jgi:hypothetical protein
MFPFVYCTPKKGPDNQAPFCLLHTQVFRNPTL